MGTGRVAACIVAAVCLAKIGLFWGEIYRTKFFDQLFVGRHGAVLCSCLLSIVEVTELGHGTQIDVVPQVTEERGGNSPCALSDALLLRNLYVLVSDTFGGLCVDDLVEAGEHVATRDPLEHDACLHEEAPLGNLASHLLPITRPQEQAGVARLAVDSDEVEVVMEAGKGCSYIILHQIAGRRRQQMATLSHPVRECVFWQSHAHSGHLRRRCACIDHVRAPAVHALLPLREVFGDDLRQVVPDLGRPVSDGPEEAPLCIEVLGVHSQGLVLLRELLSDFLVVSGLFNGLWRHTSLEAELRPGIHELLPSIVGLSDALEVALHHVDVLLVVLVHHTRVPHDANAEFIEAGGHFLAFQLPKSGGLWVLGRITFLLVLKEQPHVDDGRLNELVEALSEVVAGAAVRACRSSCAHFSLV